MTSPLFITNLLKRGIACAAALLACPIAGKTQITVTAATFPAVHDTLHYAVDDTPTIDPQKIIIPPGFDLSWDLSKLKTNRLEHQVYLPAAAGKNVANYPQAELVSHFGGYEAYYNLTGNRLEILGYAGVDPFGFNLKAVYHLRPAFPERYAPMNFFDINSFSTNILEAFSVNDLSPEVIAYLPPGTVFDSLRIRIATSRISSVNANGTVILPFASYPVLRLKTIQYTEKRVDAKIFRLGWLDVTDPIVSGANPWSPILGVDTTVVQYFFNDQSKEVIAEIRMNTEENKVLSVRFKAPPGTMVPVVETESTVERLRIYPNPVDQSLQLSFLPLHTGEFRIELVNVLGRKVKSGRLKGVARQPLEWNMPTGDLPNGWYTLMLRTADRTEVVPVIVRH